MMKIYSFISGLQLLTEIRKWLKSTSVISWCNKNTLL